MGDALWQLERTRSRLDFLNLLKPNGHGLTSRIMPAPEQPCSHASSHGRLKFRPVIVTTAHAESSLSPSVLGWDEAATFTPSTVLVVGNSLCTPGMCKITKTSSIKHLFGLGRWVGGSPPIRSLFGFSEMSGNWRPPLKCFCIQTLIDGRTKYAKNSIF